MKICKFLFIKKLHSERPERFRFGLARRTAGFRRYHSDERGEIVSCLRNGRRYSTLTMQPLKGKIKEVYEFIEATINKNGVPPSVREICKGVNLQSPSSVHGYLEKLQELGYISKDSKKMRTITLTNSKGYTRVPVIGRVTAGQPILAFEEVTGYICYNTDDNGDYFALNVTGDSMINAGILDGDLVIVRRQATARNGEIVIAMIDGEATVKRLKIEGNDIWLLPENPAYAPIDGNRCDILGKVCSLSRAY